MKPQLLFFSFRLIPDLKPSNKRFYHLFVFFLSLALAFSIPPQLPEMHFSSGNLWPVVSGNTYLCNTLDLFFFFIFLMKKGPSTHLKSPQRQLQEDALQMGLLDCPRTIHFHLGDFFCLRFRSRLRGVQGRQSLACTSLPIWVFIHLIKIILRYQCLTF